MCEPQQTSSEREGDVLPDGDICKLFWGDSDATWCGINFNLSSKPGHPVQSENIFDKLERIRQTLLFHNVSFIHCPVCAFAVSSCQERNKAQVVL